MEANLDMHHRTAYLWRSARRRRRAEYTERFRRRQLWCLLYSSWTDSRSNWHPWCSPFALRSIYRVEVILHLISREKVIYVLTPARRMIQCGRFCNETKLRIESWLRSDFAVESLSTTVVGGVRKYQIKWSRRDIESQSSSWDPNLNNCEQAVKLLTRNKFAIKNSVCKVSVNFID